MLQLRDMIERRDWCVVDFQKITWSTPPHHPKDSFWHVVTGLILGSGVPDKYVGGPLT